MRFQPATVAFLAFGGLSAIAQQAAGSSLLDALLGNSFWQGSWGQPGDTQVITVSGSSVSYEGSNGAAYPVSNVSITGTKIIFQVGGADGPRVTLTRRLDSNVEMISTFGEHSSSPILLCKTTATHCP